VLNNKNIFEIQGIVIALCCHHKLSWQPYVNKKFFIENGLSKKSFEVMCRLSSWAVCGFNCTKSYQSIDNTSAASVNNTYSNDHNLSFLNDAEKEAIGKKCKDLINTGRILFLQENGFDAELIYYVEQHISLENTLLVATPRK